MNLKTHSADGSAGFPKHELFIQPLERVSDRTMELHGGIVYCVEQIHVLEKEKRNADFIQREKLSTRQSSLSWRAANLLLEALKSSDRARFRGHAEILLKEILEEESMTVDQLIAGFESGKFQDFRVFSK